MLNQSIDQEYITRSLVSLLCLSSPLQMKTNFSGVHYKYKLRLTSLGQYHRDRQEALSDLPVHGVHSWRGRAGGGRALWCGGEGVEGLVQTIGGVDRVRE